MAPHRHWYHFGDVNKMIGNCFTGSYARFVGFISVFRKLRQLAVSNAKSSSVPTSLFPFRYFRQPFFAGYLACYGAVSIEI